MVKQDYFIDLFLHGTKKLCIPFKTMYLPNNTTVAVTIDEIYYILLVYLIYAVTNKFLTKWMVYK